ncbi:MAG: ATP-dependent helicase HrpA [Actinomycetota bacterium]|jgi:ATP-dependent helicase HrpA
MLADAMEHSGLPIDAHRDDLMAAIRDHQVVVVAGETGSGKSTQLPQICLAMGRGDGALIGHTQPRRVAARTIAERIAHELGTELGTTVGYTVRFTDRVGDQTRVKVMTDGILLAEIQRDRLLRRYDTLIIDEAHERSLNIDFLLGYLRQLLPQRPDLKLIVTSATIDTQRFSEHFTIDGRPAPIIEVSGRTYPVEVRYRPYGAREDDPDDDRDQVQAVLDAIDELGHEGDGDVLVFLSGEREIHDIADALRRQTQQRNDRLEVLPLYARLSAVEQHRIFQPHRARRVVLSTNVAETSLTVPGVRYVVDAGTARISRYSHRLKVQRLPIEPVSQASANQRAGRCGRVAPGICIRLYELDDFESRDEFTEPEILRTNLASVILQMTALGLGDVDAFPFLDPPDPRAVRDGYALLEELGAITGQRLTRLGHRLARLPLDPRLGRMVLEAERHGCVREVLVIAAALSIQDPRERPAEKRGEADELHARFRVPGSDFLTLVKLWDHLREQQQQLGSSQFRKLCRTEYLNYLRVREWQDLFSQLRQVAGQLGIRQGTEQGHPDRVHQALLAGLLSHLGMRDDTGGTPARGPREYRGAHGSRFAIGRESAVAKASPKWVVAAELVETNRLWGHVVADVKPEWAERLGGHLVKRSYGEPYWDQRRGGGVCRELVTLYGLPIVNRTIGYDRVDVAAAREMFIRHALVEGDWTTHHTFWEKNQSFLRDLAGMSERVRRIDLVDHDAVFAFYDQRVGADVVTTRHFDRWWKEARATDGGLLTMRMEHFVPGNGLLGVDDYPGTWQQDDLTLALTYRFDPGAPDDGVTVHVPLAALNQVAPDGFDWQVPGFRDDLVDALLRSLPKEHRRELVPMGEVVAKVCAALDVSEEPLTHALARTLHDVTGVSVPPGAFGTSRVPAHLRVTFAVDDEQGETIASGKDIDLLRAQLATRVRAAIARSAPIEERKGITAWDFGDLPESVESSRAGVTVLGFPALLDDDDSVSIRVLTSPDLQAKVMRAGVRRLLLLTVPVGKRAVERDLTNHGKLAVAKAGLMSLEALEADCLVAAADRVLADHGGHTFTEAGFAVLVAAARDEMPDHAARLLKVATDILAAAGAVQARLDQLVAPAVAASADDAAAQLARLVRPGFVASTGPVRLPDVLRYVKAIELRLTKLPEAPHKDQANLREVVALERRYTDLLRRTPRGAVTTDMVDVGWMLEELRVSVFAQSLGAARGTSPTRIVKALQTLGG